MLKLQRAAKKYGFEDEDESEEGKSMDSSLMADEELTQFRTEMIKIGQQEEAK